MSGYEDGRRPHPTAISVAAEYAYHLHKDDGMSKAEAIRIAARAVVLAQLPTLTPSAAPSALGILSAIGLIHSLVGA